MKSLKLLLTIALPMFALLSSLPAAADQRGVSQEAAYACQGGVTHAWLMSEDRATPINVRDRASTKAYAQHIGYAGDPVEVLNHTIGEGFCWYRVRFTSQATGWVRGDFVSPDTGE